MSEQIPTIGRTVHYRLSAEDIVQINRRRTTGKSIADRIAMLVHTVGDDKLTGWPLGAQAHIGNEAKEGDVFPMTIVKVWGNTASSSVNGQVFLDGNDVFWATSRSVGEQPGTWFWPPRV